jgi:hypothetical protein
MGVGVNSLLYSERKRVMTIWTFSEWNRNFKY